MRIPPGQLALAALAIGAAVVGTAPARPTTNSSASAPEPLTPLPLPPPVATLPAEAPPPAPKQPAPPPAPVAPAAPSTILTVQPAFPAAPESPSAPASRSPATSTSIPPLLPSAKEAATAGRTTPPASAPAAPSPAAAQSQRNAFGELAAPRDVGSVVVTSDLDRDRDMIAPSLGATTYRIGPDQIENTPQGENAPFQEVLLRAPGVVKDSFGQVHVRGEHANLTYRVNGVLLPEGLNGFGQELDTRLIDTVTLIDGSLPAQFGFRTAGVVDVTTKAGDTLRNNELSLYGGSYDSFEPSAEFGGTFGKWDYFVTASYKHNSFGIENSTHSFRPIHDDTDQERAFGYFSYHIDDTSRFSVLLNASYSDFQIPNTAGVAQGFNLAGQPFADSARLDENQNEQNYYSVVSYQKSVDKLSFQASAFSRYGQIHFNPDLGGDLIFQGVAGEVKNSFFTNGVELDGAYVLNDQHTIRAGLLADYTYETLNTNTAVFPVDPAGAQASDQPFNISDNSANHGVSAGVYVQDEWRINRSLTLNYGLRYDRFDANFDAEGQLSPRINFVYKIDDATTAHVGYARYFVPPPLQFVHEATLNKFQGTTNQANSLKDSSPRVERSNYYDAGISRQITDAWQVNFDGFYKEARNLVDLGQFGAPVILSPFNYRVGSVYGAEFSTTYRYEGFSAFGNVAMIRTAARDIISQQFLFADDRLAFIKTHDIKLDHDSTYAASIGVSYAWPHDRVYADMLYGSGLRSGFANSDHLKPYYPVNVGYEHVFHLDPSGKNLVRLRFDVVNVFDEPYELRDGTGIGVGAPQFGERRAFFAGLAYDF